MIKTSRQRGDFRVEQHHDALGDHRPERWKYGTEFGFVVDHEQHGRFVVGKTDEPLGDARRDVRRTR